MNGGVIVCMHCKYIYSQLYALYSKGFEPGSDSRSCSAIVRVRVVLKRTVVGDSDCRFDNLQAERKSSSESSESVVCQSNVISLVGGN